MTVALVLVSHSAAAAEGVAEIARQMAPDVTVLPAGGTDEGIGTSFDRVLTAVETALDAGDGVVVLTDLGSALLTTDAVLEMLDDVTGRVRVPPAPFVEGAVAAAVEAQQRGDLDAVEAAAVRAGTMFAEVGTSSAGAPPAVAAAGQPTGDGVLRTTVTLRNPLGLHARPAAVLARAVADSGASVRVGGVNGSSVLELMALGATGGQELVVEASGESARAALDTVVSLMESGFGEA